MGKHGETEHREPSERDTGGKKCGLESINTHISSLNINFHIWVRSMDWKTAPRSSAFVSVAN